MNYIEPIKFAFFTFPFIAFLFTLPYIFHQYHKYGAVIFKRALIVYSFILYLLCAYFLVILPLPSIQYVSTLNTPWVQLVPFTFISDFFAKSSFVFTDFHTYFSIIKEPYFYQVFYNIILTIPFGIYLKYYFRCSLKKTVFFSFLLSLFFEGTQLSGLYGIYPRPYRLFDVDDLILNTIGGFIGYFVTPLFSHFLPERKKLDQLSYQKGTKISCLRRMMAFSVDMIIVFLLSFGLNVLGFHSIYFEYFISVIIVFFAIPIFSKGFTPGKKVMNIQIVTTTGEIPKLEQYIIRYGTLYLLYLPIPFYFFYIIPIFSSILAQKILLLFLSGFLFMSYIALLFHMVIWFISKKPLWYEMISQTQNKSTITVEEEECDSEIIM